MLMRMSFRRLTRLTVLPLLFAAAAAMPLLAQPPVAQKPTAAPPLPQAIRWESAIARFEAADRKSRPPQGAVLFIGSSSIVKWKTLAQDFPGVQTLNRGFGGTVIADSTRYVSRIVVPYHPRKIVFFAGDNDIGAGRSPQAVAADFAGFVAAVRAALPDVPIAFIAIKPSLSRWRLHDAQIKANRLVSDYCQRGTGLTFINVYGIMLGSDGKPRPELFVADGLHMTPAGYALWTPVVAPFVTAGSTK